MNPHEFFDLLHDPYPPVIVDDLARLEKRLDLKLPEEYREFLLRKNGGYFHDHIRFEETVDSIKYFLACRSPFNYCDIEWNYQNIPEDWIPGYLLPIAFTELGHAICIGIEGEDAGKIYTCSRDADVFIDLGFDGDPEELAPSLGDFIEQCEVVYDEFEVPVEDCPSEVRRLFEDIYHNDVSGVELALKQGIDPNVRLTDGTTPLTYAAVNCRFEIIDVLLARGADPNAQDDRGVSVVGRAVYHQCSQCIRWLAARGADLNLTELSGESPLDLAIEYGYTGEAGTLILLGADSALRRKRGQSLSEFIDSASVGTTDEEERNWLHEQVRASGR